MTQSSASSISQSRDSTHFWARPRFVLAMMSIVVALLIICMVLLAVRHHYETLKVLAGAFSSLFATIAGAFLAFWFALLQIEEQTRILNKAADDRRQLDETASRQELTFEMHREFSNESMLKARTEASLLLSENPTMGFSALYRSLPGARTRSLFLVVDFYDRLALAIMYGRVDVLLVPQLFGAYFVWWWIDEFEQKLVAEDPSWPEHVRIKQLHDWIKDMSDPNDYSRWSSRASRS